MANADNMTEAQRRAAAQEATAQEQGGDDAARWSGRTPLASTTVPDGAGVVTDLLNLFHNGRDAMPPKTNS